ncbi:MAG: aldehyde dehydrogenase [Candidatus Magasanikbacteria bacterium RIFCSPLOWO2_02_FULL_44_11]|uniref:Aldehyde dehydrogenase n=2 Tax=Candidatus Magasanikiibacteriota TaxID=1752731 RepID=A0A1F6NAA5_9BACT|nr:MAG: aldehyde dehydrogenase [Candidatus Magasanikbacteria bacterium RIFCSPHIGHO2_02_FULL_45_10]OGH80633.1 MAG: aldehyde dehydrogenase [Candidatus Magasanikbacteria bacterium RIFCSPLOWO2_02_FULL_44_11]
MKTAYPIYLGGVFTTTTKDLPVIFPYTNQPWTTAYLAGKEQLEEAIQKAQAVENELKALPTYVRAEILLSIAQGLKDRHAEFTEALMLETGKPLFYARGEVDRAIFTFTDAAEETKRVYGEWLALDRAPSGANHEAVVRRFPVGLVAAIAPFNFPLNLVAHKLAPAIAAGCPIIIKPASKTPISALLLAELIDQTALPKGAVSVLPMDRATGDQLVTDGRFKLLTFTGSPDVGWDMKNRAGKKKVVLELGGNAGLIVTPSANMSKLLKKIGSAAFGQSGQSCIHTQRIYVHENVREVFVTGLIDEAKKFVYGDPREENVMFSSMIDGANADRIDAWVKEAVADGAKVLYGGQRLSDTGYSPTILTATTKDMKVCSKEAFAPVVIVETYTDFKEAVRQINDSDFGLQCGVFTNNLEESTYAFEHLDVGGVVINNVANFRADNMPYGGVKDSGLGREGVRYAIEDMTELKVLIVNKDF